MKNILLVEDDEALAYSLARHLETMGYNTTAVTSSMAALKVLDSDGVIDLLLTDLVMPKGQPSGLALARMARMKRLDIKVAFISGYDVDGYSLPGKLCRKPLDVDHLVAEVAALLAT